jgi:cell division protein FtsQ
MKKSFLIQWEAKKNRLKRRAGEVFREIGRAILLTGAIMFVTAALLIGYDLILYSQDLRVRETVVKGCQELTEKEVLTMASVRPSANMLTINRDAIDRRIRTNPWVQDVYVGREFPSRLVIVVRERKAVALLEKDKGFYLVDGEGTPFKKLETGEDSDLPILTGCVRAGILDETLVMKSLALLNDLATIQDGPEIGKVSEIHGNETFGLSLFADTGLCLKLGFDGYENKLKRLTSVMTDLDRKNLRTGFLLIDLSNLEKISVQRRNILEPAGPRKKVVPEKEFRI